MAEIRNTAPDGGYGWAIVFASALYNFLTIPLMHTFSLIFKDTFESLNFSAVQGSLILNLNCAFGLTTGLISGALIKIYGFRKIAFVAGFLLSFGVILTSFADNFAFFIMSYGLITSLGIGTGKAACGLAMNTYFIKRRSRAVSIAVTITGLGPIVIPQVISLLLTYYTSQGTIFIYGGVCTHVFIAAMLLQPVEWHMKQSTSEDNLQLTTKNGNIEIIGQKVTENEDTVEQYENISKKDTIKKSVFENILDNLTELFDLDLLKDPVFLNLLFGLGFAVFAEFNFNVSTPFMLKEYGLSTDQIAFYMSVSGVTDIIFRLLAPSLAKLLKRPPRLMYAFSIFLLIISRFIFIASTSFNMLLVIGSVMGAAKGVRKVFMALVIPSHVPIEKLAIASGMEMMTEGLCMIIGGSLLGLMRDLTGSYTYCVIIMNCASFTTILMWSTEAIIKYYRKKHVIDNNKQHYVVVNRDL